MNTPLLILVTLAILVRIFSNSFSNVFQKQLVTKGASVLSVNFYTYLFLAVASIPLLVKGVSGLPMDFWLYTVSGGIAGVIGNAFLIKSLEKGELSVLGPINAYKSIVGILFGMLLLKEYPNFGGILGILLIIGGSYYVLDSAGEPFSFAVFRKKEIQFRLLALVLTGIEAVFIKRVILASSAEMAFVSWSIAGAFFSWILLLVFRQPMKTGWLQRNLFHKLLLLVLCMGLMQFSTNVTLTYIPVGYALALFQLSIVVTVFLGNRIFNESNFQRKLIGAVIMLTGSVFILLSK